jgi:hypothetical protein
MTDLSTLALASFTSIALAHVAARIARLYFQRQLIERRIRASHAPNIQSRITPQPKPTDSPKIITQKIFTGSSPETTRASSESWRGDTETGYFTSRRPVSFFLSR